MHRKAAYQDLIVAQFNLAAMFHTCEGVSKDLKEAVCWWRKAAKQGDAGAQIRLVRMYRDCHGVLQDLVMWQGPRRGQRSHGGSGTIGPSGLKLLVAYESRTHYQPRFDFYGIARRSVPKIVEREMKRAIYRALQPAQQLLSYRRFSGSAGWTTNL